MRRNFLYKISLVFLIFIGSLLTLPEDISSQTQLKQGIFLFSSPMLRDPEFLHTVVFLISYEKKRGMGIIINRPTEIPLTEVIPELGGVRELTSPLFVGGPVNRNMLLVLLQSDKPPSTAQKVFEDVYFAEDKETITEVLENSNLHKKIRVYAGYSGWGSRQLDWEVERGDWIVVDADKEKLFNNDPSTVWPSIFETQKLIYVRNVLPSSYLP